MVYLLLKKDKYIYRYKRKPTTTKAQQTTTVTTSKQPTTMNKTREITKEDAYIHYRIIGLYAI